MEKKVYPQIEEKIPSMANEPMVLAYGTSHVMDNADSEVSSFEADWGKAMTIAEFRTHCYKKLEAMYAALGNQNSI